MERLPDSLIDRVNRLAERRRERILSTTPTPVAIAELIDRNESLEQAVREIALEVEQLAAQLERRQ